MFINNIYCTKTYNTCNAIGTRVATSKRWSNDIFHNNICIYNRLYDDSFLYLLLPIKGPSSVFGEQSTLKQSNATSCCPVWQLSGKDCVCGGGQRSDPFLYPREMSGYVLISYIFIFLQSPCLPFMVNKDVCYPCTESTKLYMGVWHWHWVRFARGNWGVG